MAKHRYRFFARSIPESGQLTLLGDEHKHLAKVLRLSGGTTVEVFDGRGIVAIASVASIANKLSQVRIETHTSHPKPTHQLVVGVGCLAPKKMAALIPMLVEVGVDAIHCFLQPHLDKQRLVAQNALRCQKLIIEAGKQCKRAWLPSYSQHANLESFLNSIKAQYRLIAFDSDSQDPALSEGWGDQKTLCAIVGSEIGLGPAEHAILTKNRAKVLNLGPQILRASTAALLAAGIFNLKRPASSA